ncbi:unnamed protein product [Protopolystoma xenopodis]|uniref:Uncharacterized protein n=1 Tax=Protopolystoma xenopodis TaxID=117903 RepID=A0A448WNL9_9PLAT|nr:unnamed protein product [Protopolystoma xenopodis]
MRPTHECLRLASSTEMDATPTAKWGRVVRPEGCPRRRDELGVVENPRPVYATGPVCTCRGAGPMATPRDAIAASLVLICCAVTGPQLINPTAPVDKWRRAPKVMATCFVGGVLHASVGDKRMHVEQHTQVDSALEA